MNLLWRCTQPLLFKLDPEKAHKLALYALKTGLLRGKNLKSDRLRLSVAGLSFSNPVGLAAGFDKDGKSISGLLKLGFGHIEIGTVTPQPQTGNSSPRLFRLTKDKALINRMGFNNEGHDVLYQRLEDFFKNRKHSKTGLIGLNIGVNKDSSDRINDYIMAIKRFYNQVDYFTVNISSPNTPNLRDLQTRENLEELLQKLQITQQNIKENRANFVPIFLKIAPDLTESQLDDIADIVLRYKCNGLVISNTTLSRPSLISQSASETGGLSGQPLFNLSTIVLAKMRKKLGKDLPIIGVGGIYNGQTALEKIRAGADLIQIYSAMIFNGPYLIERIIGELVHFCHRDGVHHISDYRDQHVEKWSNCLVPSISGLGLC